MRGVSQRSRLHRLVRATSAWLAATVVLSALVRGWIGLSVPTAWILPDEVLYSELAKSIAAGHRPEVRGVPVFGWGAVYPTLIAPAWALVGDPVRAYHAALAIGAVVMSLAAVPAYHLAGLFVTRRAAFLVAAMTVLVPSMAFTGVLMTENAFYPVFLLCVLLIARAVQRPSAVRQALAFGGLGLVAFTRIQGLALVGGYVAAALVFGLTANPAERRGYLRRFVPSVILLLAVCVAPVVASVARGEGVFGWLGARSGTFASLHVREVPEWFVYLASDLILYVAVIPAAATAVMVTRGLRRDAPDHVRLFAAVAFSVIVAMLGSVALVSASMDVDGTKNLNERYVFYIVPLLFAGLALWVQQGLPRRRPWAPLVVAGCCLLAVVLPVDRLEHNAAFQSVGLLPWIGFSLSPVVLAALMGAFALGCGLLWLACRPDRAGRLWITVGVWMAFVAVLAVGSNAHWAATTAHAFEGRSPTWIEDAVPVGAPVAVLWDERRASPTPPDPFSFWIMVDELFNRNVGSVYRIGPPTYYEGFLPTVPVRVGGPDRTVLREGRPLEATYVLSSCRTPVEGTVVASAPRGAFRLVAVEGPVRLSRRSPCTRAEP